MTFHAGMPQARAQGDTAQSGAAGASRVLQGGAEVVVLTLTDLRDVGVDLSHLKTAANHLYEECTMQQVTINTMPEMIGPGAIINLPVSTTPTGVYIPPKPKRVEAAMAEIRPVATLLKTDVDQFLNGEKQLSMPGDLQQELQTDLKQWVASVNNIYGQLQILEPLAASPPYNQAAMAQATWAIVEDTKELERVRKIMYKALQREAKREARERKEKK